MGQDPSFLAKAQLLILLSKVTEVSRIKPAPMFPWVQSKAHCLQMNFSIPE